MACRLLASPRHVRGLPDRNRRPRGRPAAVDGRKAILVDAFYHARTRIAMGRLARSSAMNPKLFNCGCNPSVHHCWSRGRHIDISRRLAFSIVQGQGGHCPVLVGPCGGVLSHLGWISCPVSRCWDALQAVSPTRSPSRLVTASNRVAVRAHRQSEMEPSAALKLVLVRQGQYP